MDTPTYKHDWGGCTHGTHNIISTLNHSARNMTARGVRRVKLIYVISCPFEVEPRNETQVRVQNEYVHLIDLLFV